jgi:lysophospholipase L1-like esterase
LFVWSAPLGADRILVIGDSWANPVGPPLQEVLKENGHTDIAVDTPPFVGYASQLSSPSVLNDISTWLAEKPDVKFVQLSIGGNDWLDSNWVPTWAGAPQETNLINAIVSDVDVAVDHIRSLRPDIRILWSSYDFPRPLPPRNGTPAEVNAFLIRLAEGMAQFAASKPGVSFVDMDGTLQVAFGFDGVQHSSYDPGFAIPPGDPSLPNPAYPSPFAPFLLGDRWHLKPEGYKALAQAQYDGYYASVLSGQDFQINAGLNDAWYDPATAGQGFLITVFPDVGQMFLAWFTYDLERPGEGVTAKLGEPGHRWLTAQGPYADNQAVLDLWVSSGGVFDAAEPPVTREQDGEIIIEFSGCNAGTLSYDIASVDRQGVIPIERVSLDNVALCEALNAQLSGE